ncbi:MAG TPA: LysR family transcriptional regulator [Povalibacter sp.]|uniref:LysR family transcriptional regulator n=1 Tax=Povalibacter sp. TaxID=1962978 RepID=UPI002CE0F32B|nr:LysR family transcriptional regulator [Povalibacter sp.]HMN47421.1 LysR family transcriptional regulator [Povalibacter sp.]
MHLPRIDLNLFTVFDAIYREGGITPASKRLHLSQPAVSHALARLREMLNDPLFERHGNAMVPTPKARALAATIGRSLGALEHMMQHAGQFDPLTSDRTFTMAVREAHEYSFLPALLRRVRETAPNVDVASVRIDRRDLEEDLQSGELDVGIDVALPLSLDVRRECMSAEPLVVLARADHPAIRGSLDLDTYLTHEHVLVTGRRRGGGYEDAALNRAGVTRRIRVRCQQHVAACEIVSQSDVLTTMTRNQAELANRHIGNQMLLFPLDSPPLETFLYWHGNVHEDAANAWFRDLVRESMLAARTISAL